MRKMSLLLAAGAIWLFLAAIPVFADGGPHVAATNSGVSTLTADSCAGCHRAHTAKGEYLINQASEEALCLGCHGTAVTGATTSVMDGVQYALGVDGLRNGATTLGALRAGGFDMARIGGVGRIDTGTSYKSKVTVNAAGAPVTSSHIAMTENGLTNPHVLWGNGANGSGAGPSVTLGCTDCHNPHGNGQYRILNTAPAPVGATAMSSNVVDVKAVDPVADVIYTKEGHPYQIGDLITIAGTGTGADGSWVIWAVPNGISFQVQTVANTIAFATAADIPAGTYTSGTIVRSSVPIADAPLGTPTAGVYPLRNYTVIQTMVTVQADGTGATFYASGIATGNTTGDYWHRQVPWNAASGSTYDGPNGLPATVAASNQVAFNQQMTAWCSSCHTRYFAYQNPNPGTEQGSSTFLDRTIASFATTTITISTVNPAGGNALTSSGFALGDKVRLTGTTPDMSAGTWYIVYASGMNIRVSSTFAGSPVTVTAFTSGVATRLYPATASQWFFPRQDAVGAVDSMFSYQHSTRADRVCSTCHVAHGSNRVMSGTFAYNYTQPDGSAASVYTVPDPDTHTGSVATADSRLLKVDNRGTCQGCHDPTSTWAAAQATNAYAGATGGITGGTWTSGINTGGTPVLP